MIECSSVTRDEALKLAQDLVDYRAKSMVQCGRDLAMWVLGGADAEATVAASSRIGELLEDRRRLCGFIERLKSATFDETKTIVAEMITACAAMQ